MKTKHLLFAVPLAAMGLASCSNEEMKPQAIMTGETIKTSLAINVPTEGYTTRQSADITQNNNNNFRGMQDLMLYSLIDVPNNNTNIGKGQELASLTGKSMDNSSHVYTDVQLPIGAKNFLLYGRANPSYGTNNVTVEDKFTNGVLNATMATTTGNGNTQDIKFNLENIIGNNSTDYTTIQSTFLTYLNNIVTALNTAKSNTSTTTANQVFTEAYDNFTASSQNGLRAGSATMIKQNVQDLCDKIMLIKSTNDDATDGIADKVLEAINMSPFKTTESTVNNDEVLVDWADDANEKTQKFPNSLGLPDGAAILTYINGTFSYVSPSIPNYGAIVQDITKITYPAELYYYDNTPLWATSKTMDTDWWAKTAANWNGVNWAATGDNEFAGKGIIDLTTRTVALDHNINYGVACLETTVKCGSNSLQDNAKAVAGAIADQTIAVPANGFTVTGILVGGQPDEVGWDFTHSGTNMDKTIYDKQITGMAATYNTATGINYTLLLDNYSKSGNGQNPVNVAIELENNSGQGFYGIEGYIPNGEKFYLIAKLEIPSNQTQDITFPNGETRRYPYTGTPRIFMQDYKTVANFTINSLQKAYVTIPDMRSVKLELGVSVDLKWEVGFTFNPVID